MRSTPDYDDDDDDSGDYSENDDCHDDSNNVDNDDDGDGQWRGKEAAVMTKEEKRCGGGSKMENGKER